MTVIKHQEESVFFFPEKALIRLEDQTYRLFLLSCRFLEEFDSITKIGKGANGSVYKARRKLEKKTFAVKIVKLKE